MVVAEVIAFVSHDSDHDGPVAMAICGGLEQRGVRCWIAARDINAGVPWPQAIVQGINASRLLILILSSSANESKWVLREVMAADQRGLPILPVRVEEVQPAETLEFILGPAQRFDAYPPPVEQYLDRLEHSVRLLGVGSGADT